MILFTVISLIGLSISMIYAASDCSLTLTLKDDHDVLVNGTCELYKIDGIHSLKGKSPKQMQRFVKKHHVAHREGHSLSGVIHFPHLEKGSYLVCQSKTHKGYYPIKSFTVKLPAYRRESGDYDYHVEGAPKVEKKIDTADTPKQPGKKTKTQAEKTVKKTKTPKKTPQAEKKVHAQRVKTGDETVVSMLVGMMLISVITMIAAKMIK